ncbi:MAG: anthranilate synthase component II [Syntrophothermus sp.]
MNLLLIDNHDSFTWNLVELFQTRCKCTVNIVRSEYASECDVSKYRGVIFSPGPGLPDEHPGMNYILDKVEELFFKNRIVLPVLGVCLGMQAIAIHYSGRLYNLDKVVHGQSCKLYFPGENHFLFKGIQEGTRAGLYHSWAVDPRFLPGSLEVTAVSEDNVIMALQHKTLPVCGIQFHPESVMTMEGYTMMMNWLFTEYFSNTKKR